MLRILIADDHEVVRFGLRQILEAQANWEVVAEASDGKEAVSRAIETKPDICIVDHSLPLMNGLEVTRQIRARVPKSEILIFTMHENETLVQELLRAGAKGYLLKSDAKTHLIEAIASLASHRPFFTQKVSETLLDVYLARPEKTVVSDHEPRAHRRAADCRGAHQQGGGAGPQHQPEDGRDAPRYHHAQTAGHLLGGSRPLRYPQQDH